MKALILLLLLAPAFALADTAAPPPPPPNSLPEKKAPGDMGDLTKEMEDFSKTAEGLMNQVEKLATPPTPDSKTVEDTKAKAMKLASDDKFLKAAGELWQNPDRNKMLLIQFGFFVLMYLLKAWRQSRCSHWFRRLLVGFSFSLLTFAGLLYVIPFFVLGEPFRVFTGTLWRVLVVGS